MKAKARHEQLVNIRPNVLGYVLQFYVNVGFFFLCQTINNLITGQICYDDTLLLALRAK